MSLLLDSTLKVSLIVLVALGATILLRRRSAAVRHWVLAVAIACAAATPLLGLIMPSWHVHLGTFLSASQVEPPGSLVSTATVQVGSIPVGQAPVGASSHAPASTDAPTGRVMFAALGSIWLAGSGISLLILIVGLVRLKWLASRARRIERGRWVDLSKEICGAFGLRRPVVLLESDHPTLLVTWGLTRPKVILPATASSWAEDRARIVLRHELAHIRRGDWVVQMAAEVLRSIFWFNPLVWVASARLRQESEYACDDAVLDGAVEGADYAGHLLDLARTLHAERRTGLAALAMARPSSLEGRIRAMLNVNVNRKPPTRWSRLFTVIALLSLTLPIAGLGAQSTFFTVSGSILDGTNRVLPNVIVVLTNVSNKAKHEVRSDSTGRFEFVGVPAGEYVLEASEPGFATFRDKVTVAGRNIDRNIELQVGSLMETITVSDRGGQKPSAAQADSVQQMARLQAGIARQRAQDRAQRALERCSGVAGSIGGNILAPVKLVDVKPEYPENLKSAKVGGVVVMEAVIGTDGTIQDVQVMSSPDPDLGSVAVEAVRQWQFSATLLNCTPIDVRMQVTVNFAIQP
jgi:TonB family protein